MKEKVSDGSDEHLLEAASPSPAPGIKRRRLSFAPSAGEWLVFLLSGSLLFAVGCLVGRGWLEKRSAVSTDRPGSGVLWSLFAWCFAAAISLELMLNPGDSLRDLGWTYKRFQGSMYLQDGDKYRGEPSPEIDAEWERFSRGKWVFSAAAVLNVSEQEVHRSMNDDRISTTVKLSDRNGGGYMGTLELFHQMHCLDILRKWTYLDYYKETDQFFHTKNNHLREHTDHCIDMIRQSLMCNGDTGLVLFDWVEGMELPTPDFSTMHQCRDPEEILKWAQLNSAPVIEKIRRIGGENELEGFL